MKLLILAAFFLAANCQMLRAAEPDLSLVRDGKSDFVILHAADAPGSVRTAAQELQHYLEKVSLAKLPTMTNGETTKSAFISLGDTAAARNAGIIAKDVPLEGFRLISKGGNLYILGPDTADNETTPQGGSSKGTLNGVYTFIEEYLNVRWLMPGELGEDAPRLATIIIPPVDRIEKPHFLNRRLPGIQNKLPAVIQWSARQRLGYSLYLEHSHSWTRVLPASMHEQHPDWFAEIAGKRPPPIGDRYKVETTNPEVVKHFAQTAINAFRQNPKLTVFSLSPTDSDNWSKSAASRALYEKDPHGKMSVTPLVLKFYNDVAKIVGAEFPDRKLAGYIYASYLYPPQAGVPPLEPNLIIVIAPSISYGYQLYRDSVKTDWEQILKTWSGSTKQISYYDLFNWLKGNSGAITPPAPEILNFAFPRLKKYNIQGVYIYGTEEWSQAAVTNYVLAKMVWNPELDANVLCDEFYRRAYGEKSGAIIRTLYHRIDAAVKLFYNKDLTANYTATPNYMNSVLAANYLQIEAAYTEAQAASADATPNQRARLAYFGDNLVILQWQLRSQGFLPERKDSALYRSEADIDTMVGRVNPGFGVTLAPGLKRAEKVFPPVRAEWAAPIATQFPVTPLTIRGNARFIVFPRADQDVIVSLTKNPAPGIVVRCEAFNASGNKLTGGILRGDSPVHFLGSAGQIYYVEVTGTAAYEISLKGAPYALAADSSKRGVHIQGKSPPFYFRVPAGTQQFNMTISSGAPGETSLNQLYAPSGKLVQTFDTQTLPVARVTMTKATAGDDWEGWWCLTVGKAKTGSLDDVFVVLDPALPQWFTIDPIEPLVITPLKPETK